MTAKAKSFTYKGTTFTRTSITTGSGSDLRHTYKAEGRFRKPASARPFLVSQAESRDWVNGLLFVPAYR